MNTIRKIMLGALAFAVILSAFAFLPAQPVSAAAETRGGPGGGQGWGAGQGAPAGQALYLSPLSESEAADLQGAILEEYGALNLYNAVIDQFGSQIPFERIALAEAQHVAALVRIAEKYGIEVPANPGLSTPVPFADVAAACQAGVNAEIADAALYDELMAGTQRAELLRVYSRLQSASLNSHLPAFELCVP